MENKSSDLHVPVVHPLETSGQKKARDLMVRTQIEARGIQNSKVLEAMRKVQRHLFLPDDLQKYSYDDKAIHVGWNQTISQPYIVAYMSERLALEPGMTVLEIGTGTGYLTAILNELGVKIVSVEIVPELHKKAIQNLETWIPSFSKLQTVLLGDAYEVAEKFGAFDRLVASACFPTVPKSESPFFRHLKDLAKAVLPIEYNSEFQYLLTLQKKENSWVVLNRLPVKFVPLEGKGKVSF
ncbi:hypothetical protein CH373_16935 [Leptospira perolatii]|uniref:Protein-L-isoaspartate O-methyltransferase n=1 Tax=Leptospira perolatii TaxID=2023191 RepID=A0A2M9ZIN0_9LEPT|nr:protein-L-isoaspartate O-methyltransferase [Leptospira perolatii]PJZ68454.1 hypothetical protein CH360_16065 [Leptospira perolatii]PJZ71918.1 hypothetical protein CH373_16935 [Leptospira perolatii]